MTVQANFLQVSHKNSCYMYVLRVLLNSGGGDTCNFFKVFPFTTYFDVVKANQSHL